MERNSGLKQNDEPKLFGKMILRKNKSFDSQDGLATYHDLTVRVKQLQMELELLKKKVHAFEEETDRHSWALRYARRIAILSNVLTGLWIFWTRFWMHVQQPKKNKIWKVLMNKQKELNNLFYDGYVDGVRTSWVFLIGSLLLSSKHIWKRYCGFACTTSFSLYLSLFLNFLPWSNYINVFCNTIYVVIQLANRIS